MGVSRRDVLAAGAWMVAARIAAAAQAPARVWRIGFLSNGTTATSKGQLDAFVRGMAEAGHVEGRQFVIVPRYAEGKLDRLPALVGELVAERLDIVFAPSGIAAQAMKDSGTALPIVFALAPDPVGQGFGASLARPGGNMTGLTSTHTELAAKRIEILREAFPGIRRIAILYFRALAAAQVLQQVDEVERAAKALGLSTFAEESPKPDDFERAFATIGKQRPDALIVVENPMFFTHRAKLTELANALRIPAIYNVSEYVRAGGLMCYGASYEDLNRRAAAYVVKILSGAPPGELPIERPTKFEFVINAKAAKAIGVTIPHAMLLRADEVIVDRT